MMAFPLAQNLTQATEKVCPYVSFEVIQCIQTFYENETEAFKLR